MADEAKRNIFVIFTNFSSLLYLIRFYNQNLRLLLILQRKSFLQRLLNSRQILFPKKCRFSPKFGERLILLGEDISEKLCLLRFRQASLTVYNFENKMAVEAKLGRFCVLQFVLVFRRLYFEFGACFSEILVQLYLWYTSRKTWASVV